MRLLTVGEAFILEGAHVVVRSAGARLGVGVGTALASRVLGVVVASRDVAVDGLVRHEIDHLDGAVRALNVRNEHRHVVRDEG